MECSRTMRVGFEGASIQRFVLISFLVLGLAGGSLAASDEAILLEFKRGVTSDPSNVLANWQNSSLTSSHFCNWTGVTCDRSSRVTNIALNSSHLSGKISPQLGGLTNLVVLDLSNNSFVGHIPAEIGNLSNLVNLSLSFNYISGSIPVLLGNLRQLSILDLSFNNLTGFIAPELGNCTNLTQISLNSNLLGGRIPTSIWELRGLQRLNLSENFLTSVAPPSAGSFQGLTFLDISSNNLSGQVLPLFSNATKLLSLSLSNNRLSGLISAVENFNKNLSGLFLSSNFLTGTFTPGLFNLTALVELEFAKNRLHGVLPNNFENLLQLERLDLSENNFTGEIPDSLGSFVNLVLDLRGNHFSGPIPSTFGSKSNSFSIYLDLSNNMLSGSIPPSLGNLLFTTRIKLSGNKLTGSFPELIRCYQLQTLDLSNNSLTGYVPADLDALLSQLTYFNVAQNQLKGTIGEVSNRTEVIIIRPGNDGLCLTTAENLCLAFAPATGPLKNRNLKVLLACLGGVSLVVLGTYWVCFQHFRRVLYLSDAVSGYCRGHEPVRLTVQDIITATSGYDESRSVGYGGTSTVYRGLLSVYPFVIAVKKFHDGDEGRRKLVREAQIMRCLRHRNIVEAWGMTSIPRKVNVLVLNFADNGTLSHHLYPPNPGNGEEIKKCELNWDMRLQIAMDVAAALRYLHNDIARGMAVIHGDLKPANIFLDANMIAKVGDFGLAKILIPTDGDQRLQRHWEGTFGYSPPEHAEGVISTAGDVYSFGVVILELVTRTRPSHYSVFEQFGGSFVAWARSGFREDLSAILDSALADDLTAKKNEIALLFRVGLFCTRQTPHERPTMLEVVEMLHSIHRQNVSSEVDQQGNSNSVPSMEELIYDASFTSIHVAKKKDWTKKFYAFDYDKSNPNPRNQIPNCDSWFSLFQLDMRDSKLLRAVGFDSFAIKNIRQETRRRTKSRREDSRGKSWVSRLWGNFRNRPIEESNSETSTTSGGEERTERASKTIMKQHRRS